MRSRLFTLAVSALLPLVIAAVLGTAYLIANRREQAQRSALDLARALATAVDSELEITTAVLQNLALSTDPLLVHSTQFQELARRAARQQGWPTIRLADASGRIVWSSDSAPGEAVNPTPLDPASMKLALQSGAPVIGPLVESEQTPGGVFPVRVPVLTKGQVTGVLFSLVSADHFTEVLRRQNLPPSWIAGIFDQNSVRVARTKPNTVMRPAPSLQAMMDTGAREGMGPTETLEGVPSFSGFHRLKSSGWTVAVGISQAEVNLALLPLLLSLGGGLLVSLALSGYLAVVFARRVSQPIDALNGAADALGRGERVALPALGISELDEVGTALCLASVERDVRQGERKQSEAERERLLRQVTDALRKAEEAGRGKDQFLAMLAHELRNPLAPVRNAVEILRLSPAGLAQPSIELLPMMERQLAHMARLLDDLLDVSRIANGKIELRRERIDIAQAVEAAVEASTPLIDSMGHQISVSLPPRPLMLDADPVRVAQIISNLLNNAARYSARGGRIHLSAEREGRHMRLAVKDGGIGIRFEHLDGIFGLFVQVDRAADHGKGGLGVGLSLVRTLAEMHGGRVAARSPGLGQGSEFIVHLPATPDERADEALSIPEEASRNP
ncbi:MAG: sensor histidine kinase [Ramlibacter sp.]